MRIWAKSNIKVVRAKKGFLAKDLAAELEVTRQFWTDVENRKRGTSIPTASKACEILEVEFDEIFEIEGGGF